MHKPITVLHINIRYIALSIFTVFVLVISFTVVLTANKPVPSPQVQSAFVRYSHSSRDQQIQEAVVSTSSAADKSRIGINTTSKAGIATQQPVTYQGQTDKKPPVSPDPTLPPLTLVSETTTGKITSMPPQPEGNMMMCSLSKVMPKRAIISLTYGLGKDEHGADIARMMPKGCDLQNNNIDTVQLIVSFGCGVENEIYRPSRCGFRLGAKDIGLPTNTTYVESLQAITYVISVNQHDTYKLFNYFAPDEIFTLNV